MFGMQQFTNTGELYSNVLQGIGVSTEQITTDSSNTTSSNDMLSSVLSAYSQLANNAISSASSSGATYNEIVQSAVARQKGGNLGTQQFGTVQRSKYL